MSQLVTIFGGSGFVGRYVARRMAKQGWRVRVAVRRPDEAIFVKPYGTVGQVEPVLANIRDDASVAAAMLGADAVVNCVGILGEVGPNKFDPVQHEGAERIARLAAAAKIPALVHLSAIGADEDSDSDYLRTKALGEAGVLEHFPCAIILRPSIIFGTEDQFFNRFASMTRMSPILPIAGGATKFQPVYVDDVANAAVKGVLGQAEGGVYELGGPEVADFRSLMQNMLGVIQRKRIVLNLPFFAARLLAGGFDLAQTLSLGIFTNSILTRQQVRALAHDNVVAEGARGLADLDIQATPMDNVLPEYLWPFRASGQYAAIKSSAKNLRT
ncbi:MAG: complex I NDUFA9 subunit family protein [Paracoccaceae bacterium]|nr:complex I NDUFA9 subunit family protein [Paracoccaceae bacterium]